MNNAPSARSAHKPTTMPATACDTPTNPIESLSDIQPIGSRSSRQAASTAVNNLFKFSRRKNQRHKKVRGVWRRALRAVNGPTAYERVLCADDWFDYWHQHLDWDGFGDLSPRLRRIFLEGHARLFRYYALQAHLLAKPYQLSIVLLVDDARQDAVYFHTPNPHLTFRMEFPDVQWGLPELVALFSQWLPEFKLVAGRSPGALFLFAEDYGVSLKQPNAA